MSEVVLAVKSPSMSIPPRLSEFLLLTSQSRNETYNSQGAMNIMQLSAIVLWTVLSMVAALFAAFAVIHPDISPASRLWFWGVSTIALTMANVAFGLMRGSPLQLACGANLFVLLFHIGGASQTYHETRSKLDDEMAFKLIAAKPRPGIFGAFLFALGSSSLVVGVPYQVVGISVVLSLFCPYIVRKLG